MLIMMLHFSLCTVGPSHAPFELPPTHSVCVCASGCHKSDLCVQNSCSDVFRLVPMHFTLL